MLPNSDWNNSEYLSQKVCNSGQSGSHSQIFCIILEAGIEAFVFSPSFSPAGLLCIFSMSSSLCDPNIHGSSRADT